MLYAPEAFRRHPCRVFASEPGLQGSPQTKSILQTSHSSPIGGGGVRKRKETAISVSISQESVGINNRRSFNPALIATHSSIALRRRLLHKSINGYSNTPSRLLHSRWHRHNSSHHTKCPRLLRHGRHHDHRSTNHPETDLHHQGRTSLLSLHRLPWRMRGYYRISLSAICDFGYLRISNVMLGSLPFSPKKRLW